LLTGIVPFKKRKKRHDADSGTLIAKAGRIYEEYLERTAFWGSTRSAFFQVLPENYWDGEEVDMDENWLRAIELDGKRKSKLDEMRKDTQVHSWRNSKDVNFLLQIAKDVEGHDQHEARQIRIQAHLTTTEHPGFASVGPLLANHVSRLKEQHRLACKLDSSLRKSPPVDDVQSLGNLPDALYGRYGKLLDDMTDLGFMTAEARREDREWIRI
jgi:hypothetical protein